MLLTSFGSHRPCRRRQIMPKPHFPLTSHSQYVHFMDTQVVSVSLSLISILLCVYEGLSGQTACNSPGGAL
jgi:hypothetical protein